MYKILNKCTNLKEKEWFYEEKVKKCLAKDKTVVVQEKISGYEFTIMGFTAGESIITAPATYDYPYRFDNDKGSGTGGMGCFSCSNGLLPFINEEDFAVCRSVMKKVIKHINKDKKEFDGFDDDIKIYFGNTEHIENNTYRSVGNSRLFAVVSTGEDIKALKDKVDKNINKVIKDEKLDFRNDIASIAIKWLRGEY